MEWNTKWEWESLDVLCSKYTGIPKKLQSPDWGIENGVIDAGSLDLSGGCGGSASDMDHVSSTRSSISASTDCSSKEGMKASTFTIDSYGRIPGDFNQKKELPRTGTLPSLETSMGSSELLIGLKLGKRTYFENSSAGNNARTSSSVNPVSSMSTAKKIKPPYQNATTPQCQVEGCNLDLSSAKEYHRKHRVCESHSKTPEVIVGGLERRFCQQCSRFHSLSEFDEKKRSCRRRLSDHNARRRKPQQETIEFNSTSLSSAIYGGRQQMSFTLNNVPLSHTRPAGNANTESVHNSKHAPPIEYLLKLEKAGVSDVQHHLPGKPLPQAIGVPYRDSSRFMHCKGSSEGFSRGFRESNISSTFGAADLHHALSLLSSNSWGSSEPQSISRDHSTNVNHVSMPQHMMHGIPQGLPFPTAECWQTEEPSSTTRMYALGTNGKSGGNCQEIQLSTGQYESGFYSS